MTFTVFDGDSQAKRELQELLSPAVQTLLNRAILETSKSFNMRVKHIHY